jgi:four helix bundle protein
MRDFKTLEIWKRSVLLAKSINELTDQFPAREKFALAVQMSKSAVSIPSNIAEGCGRRTTADFKQFIHIAIGSSFELETQIEIAFLSGYLDNSIYQDITTELNIIQRMIVSFERGLGVGY